MGPEKSRFHPEPHPKLSPRRFADNSPLPAHTVPITLQWGTERGSTDPDPRNPSPASNPFVV